MTESLRKKFFALMLLASSYGLFAQDCGFLGVDIQGNIYTSKLNEIILKSANNAGTFRFSNKLLGNIYSIDVKNPMRPLLFYRDIQKLVITDNTLSEQKQSVISFQELGMYQITCIASSRIDNGIWLYDREMFQIIKVNQHFQRVIETGNLMQILSLNDFEPIKMIEANGFLYVQCTAIGILVFDIYGTYYKSIPIKGISIWNIVNNHMYCIADNEPLKFNLKTLEITELGELQSEHPVSIEQQNIYFCDGSKIVKQNILK
jgi:hypothetical protein